MAGPAASRTAYLVAYNVVQTLGWAWVLVQTVEHLWRTKSVDGLYATAGQTVNVFQGLSLLEVAHAGLGLVKGAAATSLIQWIGRSHTLYLILGGIPELWSTPAVAVLFLAWSMAEVIRYPWYALSLLGACPKWLTWLRYTMFIPLYPMGVLAELKLEYDGLPYVKQRQPYSIAMPNRLNFAFSYYVFLLVYLFILHPAFWLQLYIFMFRQRHKRMSEIAKRKLA